MSSLSIHADPDGPGSVLQAPNLPAGFPDTFKGRYIQANGITQHAVIGGDGPPLLLVHGWPENWYAWRLIMPALAEKYTVVAVDQTVTEPSAYIISNNQEEYAYLGAKWLFETLGGKGDVIYMRGAAGASADSDRDKGFKRALAEFPDVKVVQEVFTGWQQDQGKQQILDYIATGLPFDGIWTSGIDNVIVDALVESGATLVPVVGADNAGFVGQLLNVEGLQGAAVTNPGSIGGAGVTLSWGCADEVADLVGAP